MAPTKGKQPISRFMVTAAAMIQFFKSRDPGTRVRPAMSYRWARREAAKIRYRRQ